MGGLRSFELARDKDANPGKVICIAEGDVHISVDSRPVQEKLSTHVSVTNPNIL